MATEKVSDMSLFGFAEFELVRFAYDELPGAQLKSEINDKLRHDRLLAVYIESIRAIAEDQKIRSPEEFLRYEQKRSLLLCGV